jgi:hypothetical protein
MNSRAVGVHVNIRRGLSTITSHNRCGLRQFTGEVYREMDTYGVKLHKIETELAEGI